MIKNNKSKSIFALLSQLAGKYNTRIFLVGGPVRDILMATGYRRLAIGDFEDLDIAVEKDYQAVGEELAKKLKAEIIRYPQFMTMTLKLKEGAHIDIAQTREEVYYKPAVLPKVYPSTIIKDLKRRDFTINAMAMELKRSTVNRWPPAVLDPFNGQRDLKQKLIRILHDKSFIDDPTRIFRAVRFATRFDFKIEPKTKTLMQTAIKQNHLKLLSGERILYELKLIMNEQKSLEILRSLQYYKTISGLYSIKLPKKFFAEHKRLTNSKFKLIHFFSYIPESLWSKYPLEKEITEGAKTIKEFSKYRSKLIKAKTPSEVYKLLKPLSKIGLEILAGIETKQLKDKIKSYLEIYTKTKIFTNGKLLQGLKIPPGETYSKILNELLYRKLDGRLKTKQDEIDYIVKNYCNV